MRLNFRAVALVLAALAPGLAAPARASIDLQLIATGVSDVVDIQNAGDGSGRLFLVKQTGQIVIWDGAQILPTPFLDITDLVLCCGERGMLGLAFHPDYAVNGLFFVNYTDRDAKTAIARFQVTADPNVANRDSRIRFLEVPQPFGNHNGGQIQFGPDGYLYIATGDGGDSGDPLNSGQRLDTLLGKLLRIDVDTPSGSLQYSIPPGNPFAGNAGARPEIWARGLRNPWRFSFDRLTGDVFIADVGQHVWEEVSFQPAGVGGQNYGWRIREGNHCFNPSSGCTSAGLTPPVLEFTHDFGCSITGGFRYRGTALTGYAGTYFFSDYCSGRIWGAVPRGDGSWTATQLLNTELTVTTFGEGENGEIYVSQYSGAGALYRIALAGVASPALTVTKTGPGTGLVTTSPFDIHCGTICGSEFSSGATVTLTATPDAGWTFDGWSGDADCLDGIVTMSTSRTCTVAFGNGFTDDPIVAGVTNIKAIHVTELRARINTLRNRFGLVGFPWTNTALTPGATFVAAVHVREMRTALNQAYAAAGRSAPTYSDSSLDAGMLIRGAHIAELRSAVIALE